MTTEVRRRLPSPAEGTAALAVNKYDEADLVSNSVKALWDRSICLLTNVGGTNNEITARCDPAVTALAETMSFLIVPALGNTGPAELTIYDKNGLNPIGPFAVKTGNGNDLIAGQFNTGTLYMLAHFSGELRILAFDANALSSLLPSREYTGSADLVMDPRDTQIEINPAAASPANAFLPRLSEIASKVTIADMAARFKANNLTIHVHADDAGTQALLGGDIFVMDGNYQAQTFRPNFNRTKWVVI